MFDGRNTFGNQNQESCGVPLSLGVVKVVSGELNDAVGTLSWNSMKLTKFARAIRGLTILRRPQLLLEGKMIIISDSEVLRFPLEKNKPTGVMKGFEGSWRVMNFEPPEWWHCIMVSVAWKEISAFWIVIDSEVEI